MYYLPQITSDYKEKQRRIKKLAKESEWKGKGYLEDIYISIATLFIFILVAFRFLF